MIRRAFFCISLLFSLLTTELAYPESSHVKVVRQSVKSGTFEVKSESGRASVESRVLQVCADLPNGSTAILDVSMLYDPGSKLFWWQADPVPARHEAKDTPFMLPRNSVVFLMKSKFVMFWNGWGSAARILVRESSERESSLDQAQARVLYDLSERRADIQAAKFLHKYKEIAFPGLDRDFIVSKYDAVNRGLELRDLSRLGQNWQIVEDGPNGGSAVILLSDTYKVLSTNVQPAN